MLKITKFDGEPQDAEYIMIYVKDPNGVVQDSAVPEKATKGFYIFDWEIVWCYFGLHDHWESDWGIVNLDNSFKKGGEAMKASLHKGL